MKRVPRYYDNSLICNDREAVYHFLSSSGRREILHREIFMSVESHVIKKKPWSWQTSCMAITNMTSFERHCVSNHRQLDYLLNSCFFQASTKKNTKVLNHRPFEKTIQKFEVWRKIRFLFKETSWRGHCVKQFTMIVFVDRIWIQIWTFQWQIHSKCLPFRACVLLIE